MGVFQESVFRFITDFSSSRANRIRFPLHEVGSQPLLHASLLWQCSSVSAKSMFLTTLIKAYHKF